MFKDGFTRSLADATIFEEFVRRKFVGAKTFSLEGAETLIPMLDLALEKACSAQRQRSRDGHGTSRTPQRDGQYPERNGP